METHVLLGLASILVLGVSAQWLATRLKLPSILLLLLAGFVAGPVTGFLRPGELFGQSLPGLVSLAVAVILFDGGLSLKFSEIREVRWVVRRLISVGALTTMVVGTLAARLLLPLDWRLSLLLAAILVVSGPTVILPLLRQIRPRGRVGSILKWEGIFIDPIGAVLAVLVFEVILAGGTRQEFGISLVTGIARTAFIGTVVGLVAAGLLVVLLRRYWIEHHLEVPVTLGLVVAAFATSNLMQAESGLLAVTVMGVALANQRVAPVHHIVEFGETIGILLTSVLFVVLAADLELASFTALGWGTAAFIGVLVVVGRPLATVVSTLGSDLGWRERALIAWVAPRGIVAASVASVFASRLSEAGLGQAELLVPFTFTTIAAAAAIYGLTAGPVARWLDLADPDPQGMVLLGAHRWAREIAAVLEEVGYRVLLVATNRHDQSRARLEGRETHVGSILEEEALEHLDLSGIGRALAVTHNEEFNSLAALRFQELFGRQHVYQLPRDQAEGEEGEVTQGLRGRLLFGDDVTFHVLEERFEEGYVVRRVELTEEFSLEDFRDQWSERSIPLFRMRGERLHVISGAESLDAQPGDVLIALAPGPTTPEATAVQAEEAGQESGEEPREESGQEPGDRERSVSQL